VRDIDFSVDEIHPPFFPSIFFFCLGSRAFKIESRRVRVCLPASKKFSNGCRRSCIGELRSDAAEHKLFADP